MHAASSIRIVPIAALLLLAAGCVQMPIPTSPAPAAGGTAPAATPAIQPAPSLSRSPTSNPPSTSVAAAPAAQQGAGDPTRGAKLFPTLPCSSCHDVTHPLPGGVVCPNLGNIATEADRIAKSPEYHGKATDAASYLRESIVDPNAYVVSGESYVLPDGQSVMPKDFAKTLTPAQLDDLVAYLLTLK